MAVEVKDVYDRIYRYCFYKLRNQTAAEDITQEAFLRYFAQNININNGSDTAYLYTIAKNLCTDYFRRRQPEPLDSDDSAWDNAADDGFPKLDTEIAVREAVKKLEPK